MITKTKWFIFTVLIGVMPILARFIIFFISSGPMAWLNAGDVIGFGLVMVITNINMLEDRREITEGWKTRNVGISLVLAFFFAALFTAMCIHESNSQIVDIHRIKIASIVLAVAALMLSYAVVDRLSQLPNQEGT